MQTPDRVFKVLADPTRLRILCLLGAGELCVGDLVGLLGVPQPTASRHLASLRRSGLVTVRREGQWAFYALADATTEFGRTLLACLAACRNEERDLARDAVRAAELRASGGCCAGLARASTPADTRSCGQPRLARTRAASPLLAEVPGE